MCDFFCLGLLQFEMLVAHYLYLGALELKGSWVEKSLCVIMGGLSLALSIMDVGLVVCLYTWGFFGVIWKHRGTCSCCQDVEQSRTKEDNSVERAQKIQWPKPFIMDAPHHTRGVVVAMSSFVRLHCNGFAQLTFVEMGVIFFPSIEIGFHRFGFH